MIQRQDKTLVDKIQFRKHVETKCRASLQCLTQFLNAV